MRIPERRLTGENACVALYELIKLKRPATIAEIAELMGENRALGDEVVREQLFPRQAVVLVPSELPYGGPRARLWLPNMSVRRMCISYAQGSYTRKEARALREECWENIRMRVADENGQRMTKEKWGTLYDPRYAEDMPKPRTCRPFQIVAKQKVRKTENVPDVQL